MLARECDLESIDFHFVVLVVMKGYILGLWSARHLKHSPSSILITHIVAVSFVGDFMSNCSTELYCSDYRKPLYSQALEKSLYPMPLTKVCNQGSCFSPSASFK